MAKAQFHKNQRVYVKPVGTWAIVEKVLPHWTKGLDEPLRIYYDVGLGREFAAEELQSEERKASGDLDGAAWRITRARNKWQPPEDCAHHPYPGTYPVVVTNENDWGGWRVPGAEYDLHPEKIERQARLITAAPRLVQIAKRLVENARLQSEPLSNDLNAIARDAADTLKDIADERPAGQNHG
jgi:hypothetical protein